MIPLGQDPKTLPAPPGVVYNTTMSRPGAALALAALYVLASRREARVDGVCVTGAGLSAAVFCDIVGRFYSGSARVPSSNTIAPVGFAADPVLPGPPMVDEAIARKRDDGTPQYARSIQRITDTSAADALLRNAITFSVEAVVVLSAPATWLVRSLELAGTVNQYKQRVKRVVVVESGGAADDAAALKRLTEVVPVPIVAVPREAARSLTVKSAEIESRLTWNTPHPLVDVLRGSRDAAVTLEDVAAIHYALHPDAAFYSVSNGRLAIAPSQREACLSALTALAVAKPAAPPPRGGG